MSIKEYLPSPGQVVKLAIGIIVLFAIADLTGLQSWLLAPISSWRNRGQG
jgi:hypothetical protein